MSVVSTPADAADLSLSRVAFARISEGRLVARGTADRLDYKRAGGRMHADRMAAQVLPQSGTGLAALGVLRLAAPKVDGEIASHRGRAWSGVSLDAERGDTARTDVAEYEGDTVRSHTPVAVRGPGYRIDSATFAARTDGSVIEFSKAVTGEMEMEARR